MALAAAVQPLLSVFPQRPFHAASLAATTGARSPIRRWLKHLPLARVPHRWRAAAGIALAGTDIGDLVSSLVLYVLRHPLRPSHYGDADLPDG